MAPVTPEHQDPNPDSAESSTRLLGRNVKMVALLKSISQIAGTLAGVLIESESGTGKELVARAIHQHSARRNHPFIPINCAAINDSLIESELFGHVSGAFSGAIADKPGLVQLAHCGVLFLDEVSEMSLAMQSKILRLAEEGEYRPVGGTKTRHVDIRLIAASNKDLAELVRQGRFRQDLFYRLKVVLLRIPPLRDRIDDLPLLTESFLTDSAARHGVSKPILAPDVMEILRQHSWPGNVRELKNCMEAMLVTCGGVITREDISSYLGHTGYPPVVSGDQWTLIDAERLRALKVAILKHGGKKSAIAQDLGIARTTLDRRLRKYGFSERVLKSSDS